MKQSSTEKDYFQGIAFYCGIVSLLTSFTANSMTAEELKDTVQNFSSSLQGDYRRAGTRLARPSYIDVSDDGKFNVAATYKQYNKKSGELVFGKPFFEIQTNSQATAEITKPILLTILCHEAGHHLAANERYMGTVPDYVTNFFNSAAVEGESDYWASKSCLNRFSPEFKIVELDLNELSAASQFCNQKDKIQIEVCARSLLYFVKTLNFFSRMKNEPEIELSQFKRNRVKKVNYGTVMDRHPDKPCRVLTVINGLNNQSRPDCWYNPYVFE